MYEAFYGLEDKPFSMLPDPGFLYLSRQHRTALTLLEYALFNQAGFCVVTGEPGAGKTTLLRKLLEMVEENTTVGMITNTHKSFGELLDWVLSAFSIHEPNLSQVEKNQKFIDFLMQQYADKKSTLLILDEAQNMKAETLEELRMLSNINSEKDQLLQVILAGQPALKETLRQPELMQFAQRISVDYNLDTLNRQETCNYIQHRLVTAGAKADVFTARACKHIYSYSGGTPRLINLICDTAMVYGFADQVKLIDCDLIDEMVTERMRDSVVPLFKHAPTAGESEQDDIEFHSITADSEAEGVIPSAEKKTIKKQPAIAVNDTSKIKPVTPVEVQQEVDDEPKDNLEVQLIDDETVSDTQNDSSTQDSKSELDYAATVVAYGEPHQQTSSRWWYVGLGGMLLILLVVIVLAIANNRKIERQQQQAEYRLQIELQQKAEAAKKLEQQLKTEEQNKLERERVFKQQAELMQKQRDEALAKAKKEAAARKKQRQLIDEKRKQDEIKQQRLLLEAESRKNELAQQRQRQEALKQKLLRQKQVLEQLSKKQELAEKKLVDIKASRSLKQQEKDSVKQLQTDAAANGKTDASKAGQAPAFSSDPCSGPSARFLSNCRK